MRGGGKTKVKNWKEKALHGAHCVEMPLKQCDTLSVDARSLPRESIGSATTRWPCGHTGRCAGSMKYGIECNDKWYDHQPLPTAAMEK